MADKKLAYWEAELEKAFEPVQDVDDWGPALATFYRWLVSERKLARPEKHAKAVHYYTTEVVQAMENACRQLRHLDCPSPDGPPIDSRGA
jgi:hypothetical protein